MQRGVALALSVIGMSTLLAPGAAAGTGGTAPPGPARVHGLECMSTATMRCPSNGRLVAGARVKVKGAGLDRVTKLVFKGRRGRRDDVVVRPKHTDERHLEAAVPGRAKSGKVELMSGPMRLASTVARLGKPEPIDDAPGGDFFFGGANQPSLSLTAPQAARATVELTDGNGATVLRSWPVDVAAGGPTKASWDGRIDGRPAPNGRYRLRLASGSANVSVTAGEAEFAFYDHIFPIRGRHDLGQTETNNFGGGRGHQGQDMFAACGTPLAAQAGVVRVAGYHSAAGNYAVIHSAASGRDYVYMHMRDPASVKTGETVFTGQRVGVVGDTGRASGCHLHFEIWTAPGWYEGGEPIDPLPALRSWDAYS